MKKKDLKNLANKIAQCELQLQRTTDSKEHQELQTEIMRLSEQVETMDEMLFVDQMVQEILKK